MGCMLCLIPLYRAVVYGHYERLVFLFFPLIMYGCFRLSLHPKYHFIAKILFTTTLYICFLLVFFSNGMFQSLSSYWGFTIPLLCYVAIDKRLGVATFILTVVIFTLSQISIYSGHLQNLSQRNTTLIVELLHLIFIVFFTHYSMSRFSKLIKIPI